MAIDDMARIIRFLNERFTAYVTREGAFTRLEVNQRVLLEIVFSEEFSLADLANESSLATVLFLQARNNNENTNRSR